jgi:hypothetical protein
MFPFINRARYTILMCRYSSIDEAKSHAHDFLSLISETFSSLPSNVAEHIAMLSTKTIRMESVKVHNIIFDAYIFHVMSVVICASNKMNCFLNHFFRPGYR